MTNNFPFIRFGKDSQGNAIAVIGEDIYSSLTALSGDVAAIKEPENVLCLARALNHFDPKGNKYIVIDDPDAFALEYKARFEAEKDAPLDPNNPSISDFGMPRLEAITPPKIQGEIIMFFAKMSQLGMPYIVAGKMDGTEPLHYQPL